MALHGEWQLEKACRACLGPWLAQTGFSSAGMETCRTNKGSAWSIGWPVVNSEQVSTFHGLSSAHMLFLAQYCFGCFADRNAEMRPVLASSLCSSSYRSHNRGP